MPAKAKSKVRNKVKTNPNMKEKQDKFSMNKYLVIGISLIGCLLAYVMTRIDSSEVLKTISKSYNTNDLTSKINSKKAYPIPSGVFHTLKDAIVEISWNNSEGFLDSIIQYNLPVIIKNAPVNDWEIFSIMDKLHSLSTDANVSDNMILHGTRFQVNESTFILSNERDIGGMIGSKHDRPLIYTDISVRKFLNKVLDNKTFFYYTDELEIFESLFNENTSRNSQLTGSEAHNYDDGWPIMRVVNKGLVNSIDKGNLSLWSPMIWMSHPGVISQTHYDTQNNIFLQIFGKKKFVLFSPDDSVKLYQYPLIHLSYRQSQIIFNQEMSSAEYLNKYPTLQNITAYEVNVGPKDMLFIPPYWSHRVESHTLSLSLSVVSPSFTEAVLSDIFYASVPYGQFKSREYKIIAVTRFLKRVVDLTKSVGSNLLDLSKELYIQRYSLLYPNKYLDKMFLGLPPGLADFCGRNVDISSDVVLQDLLEKTQKFFDEVSLLQGEKLDAMDNVNEFIGIRKTFLFDYIEMHTRWAVGPDFTCLFIYKCLAEY